jgi:HKD family nuclease
MTFLIDNSRYKLSTIINEEFMDTHEARLAVAFLKQSGLQLIETSLDNCINHGNTVEFIVGLDFRTTEAMTLKNLLKKAENSENFHLYCYSDPSDDVETFHPKLYLFRNKNRLRAIVGSSNITRGGLQDNVELNVVLDFSNSHGEDAQPFYDFYSRVKFKSTCFIPNEDYLNLYFELQQKNLRYIKSKKSLPIEQALQDYE